MQTTKRPFALALFASLISTLLFSCSEQENTATLSVEITQTAEPTVLPSPTSTPLVAANENPLTGLPVKDTSLLDLPALLVSISHFPVEARPQAGLSFAPWVFEVYITEGATRFLTVFHGLFPEPEIPVTGDCAIRNEPFTQTSTIIGNRVWLDENANNIQEAWEKGIGGICIYLYREDGTLLYHTSTDSNGYYAFNVEPGRYVLDFQAPPWMQFVQKNFGDEETDSNVDPATGQTEALDVTSSLLHIDAGLVLTSQPSTTSTLPAAKVGPVRSGRLIYADIAAFFPDSCLIYAFASPEVLELLPQCYFVQHDLEGGGYMLDIDELKRLAQESKQYDVDYASNAFDENIPEGGEPASRLDVYFAYLNQSAWVYDAASESYWRYVDNADYDNPGVLHPEIDRLTGRQLQFENVVVLFTEHDVVSPTNLDIHLEEDKEGYALLFRDGRMYDMFWSTDLSDAERESGRHKPIHFINPDTKQLMPLKPGRTWIIVVTPETAVTPQADGKWYLEFYQPAGAQ
ncbi:MAG TPA: SdrD B-like domain-containing protein [Anaerolineales bacterium]|nr:SdrD B-like domain-containing protein [Anaerolineales bacterium]